jgi:hypothetical protein
MMAVLRAPDPSRHFNLVRSDRQVFAQTKGSEVEIGEHNTKPSCGAPHEWFLMAHRAAG